MICVQTTIGLLLQDKLQKEIHCGFLTLKGKLRVCCTSHFVQKHYSLENLEFTSDLICFLAREKCFLPMTIASNEKIILFYNTRRNHHEHFSRNFGEPAKG